MNINTNLKEENTYDAIVIGSGISGGWAAKELGRQLNEMVEDGILTKESFNELPPRVEYSLTEIGEKLVEILWQLNDWGKLLIVEEV